MLAPDVDERGAVVVDGLALDHPVNLEQRGQLRHRGRRPVGRGGQAVEHLGVAAQGRQHLGADFEHVRAAADLRADCLLAGDDVGHRIAVGMAVHAPLVVAAERDLVVAAVVGCVGGQRRGGDLALQRHLVAHDSHRVGQQVDAGDGGGLLLDLDRHGGGHAVIDQRVALARVGKLHALDVRARCARGVDELEVIRAEDDDAATPLADRHDGEKDVGDGGLVAAVAAGDFGEDRVDDARGAGGHLAHGGCS